ncbi:L-serine ammonia-lyase [Desulfopila aestuarii]|uniref:L-serine dehydratase n=1 Tax=Desulfopila aestuarii DSM 18488 TaxID=1121416 RepID=A0A1M7Y1Y6_9BACT|nr:L-serine ammonia-lyase [Desulfopila aestuarii]SHO45818.1 L-serine ammonia-lyase [Desulfopila aestuarii DSM 18488]
MFISTFDLFKIGIGPSSSHTMGPMVAANLFRKAADDYLLRSPDAKSFRLRCTLKGSLAYTGKGHATDLAVLLGVHGHTPEKLVDLDVTEIAGKLKSQHALNTHGTLSFLPDTDIIFDYGPALPEHPNGMIFELIDETGAAVLKKTYFSIGGGFLNTPDEITSLRAPIRVHSAATYPYPFDSAKSMLEMASSSHLSIASMKRENELVHRSADELNTHLDKIWHAMSTSVVRGLSASGKLPGSLGIERRARQLHTRLRRDPDKTNVNDWLCSYAMAVSEENGAGHMVVTAPTNGAAGVIPSLLYYAVHHHEATAEDVRTFLLTAAAIGGLIKHKSSISGAEVGCQGEVGSASAMAAAGFCAIQGGTPAQVEHAAEMALEHHLGMTCDPVAGLVQVPCIERNGFGAVKAFTAASLALLGEGKHFMPLDNCIAAMKQTGLEMSEKFKETSLGGLAISYTEC